MTRIKPNILLTVLLAVACLTGCRGGGASDVAPTSGPETVELPSAAVESSTGPFQRPNDAPPGEIAIRSPEGICALCDLYYAVRQSVILVRTGTGIGSGVVVDERGFVMTNAHVVGAATAVQIELADGTNAMATVVEADAELDLALLQVEGRTSWTPLTLHEDQEPRIGADVFVVGHPLGLGWTISRGIISGYRVPGEIGPSALLQTDAAVSPGNSGGPLLDDDGRVLGIVVARLEGQAQNIAFVIPSSAVRGFLSVYLP